MPHKLYPLRGYAHLCQSLRRWRNLRSSDAEELCYGLYLANIDTHILRVDGRMPRECGRLDFHRRMNGPERPYRTEVQLFKALEALDDSIDPDALIDWEKDALRRMHGVMRDLESGFFRRYGMDIADRRTVYRLCAADLIPTESEPKTPFLRGPA